VSRKPVVLREQARRDIDEAVEHYSGEGGVATGLAFTDAIERALSHLAAHPRSGSQRYGHELNLPALRSWPVSPFPHIVFYADLADRVDVWRVLHGKRDIPVWLQSRE
jgi:toxin ParE1/3/4